MAHRDKSQSREFAVGIGWKADIGRQAVSDEPVAIDPCGPWRMQQRVARAENRTAREREFVCGPARQAIDPDLQLAGLITPP
jgi:hypothetical protein